MAGGRRRRSEFGRDPEAGLSVACLPDPVPGV